MVNKRAGIAILHGQFYSTEKFMTAKKGDGKNMTIFFKIRQILTVILSAAKVEMLRIPCAWAVF